MMIRPLNERGASLFRVFEKSALRIPMLLVLLSVVLAGCRFSTALPNRMRPAMEPVEEGVYLLRRLPDLRDLPSRVRQGHVLILVPGVSSGDVQTQGRFLAQLRVRTAAQVAVFHHWGGSDPTRRMAAPMATTNAAETLAAFCQAVSRESADGPHIDVMAHSAGTIVVNKMALHLAATNSPVRLRHVLFLGTPHDPSVDLRALKERCDALVNVHSAFDKINRNVSGDGGALAALPTPPFWNRSMDTSLGGRRMRHYTFLENTPENRVQYSGFLRTGRWLSPAALSAATSLTALGLHRHAMQIKMADPAARQEMVTLPLLQRCLPHPHEEIRYYGALLAGLSRNNDARPLLKASLEAPGQPAAVRRELYQALGRIANPRDLRYLQQRRKSDPAAGDVLRDVLRDWKRKRIRPRREPRRR